MARLQARLNTAKLAATRLGDYLPLATIHVGSTQAYRPGGVRGVAINPSLEIQPAMEDSPQLASFELRDCSSPPQPGESVTIGLGSSDHRIFGGNIISVSHRQSRYVDMPVWSVRCEDNLRLFNRRLVSTKYESTAATAILKDLVATYASGFTFAHVADLGVTIDEIVFTQERLSRAITRVCQRVGARWYIDAYNDLHVFTGEESGASPATALTTGHPGFWNWSHERDLSQIRTRVFVQGGGNPANAAHGTTTTQIFLDDATYLVGANTITTGRQPMRYFYQVASVQNAVSPFFVVLASSLGGGGLVEGVRQGDMVHVVGIAQSTTLQNSIAAIEGGDGVHEYYMSDGRLTQLGTVERARAELTLFGSIEHRGSYETRDPSADVGRMLTINVSSPTHVSSVSARIQRVTINGFEEGISTAWSLTRVHKFPRRQVTYSSAAVRDLYQILGDFERERR